MGVAVLLFLASMRAGPAGAGLAWSGLLTFAAGIVYIGATFCLLHDASHTAVLVRDAETTWTVSRYTQTLHWWDASVWRAHHVLLHHHFTGDVGRDPDTRHGTPLFCKVKESYTCDGSDPTRQFFLTLSMLNTGQVLQYHDPDGYPLVKPESKSASALRKNTTAWDPYQQFSKQMFGLVDATWSWWQYPVAAVFPSVPLVLYWAARRRSASRGVAALRAAVGMFGLMLGLNLGYSMNILIDHDARVNHELYDVTPDLRLLETGVVASADSPPALDWGEVQVRTTANWAGPIWCFFFGGINYQIEHHLFPTIHHDYYPLLSPLVRETSAEFGVPYTQFHSILDGLAAVHEQYHAAAAEAAAKDMLGTNLGHVHGSHILMWHVGWTLSLLQYGSLLLCAATVAVVSYRKLARPDGTTATGKVVPKREQEVVDPLLKEPPASPRSEV